MMNYKGYIGHSEVDESTGLIFGEVFGLRDVITYQGRTVDEARQSFVESIDLYLQTCAEEGLKPDKPFSGKMLVRTKPEVHRALAAQAKAEGKSLNQLTTRVLTKAARRFSGSQESASPTAPMVAGPGARSAKSQGKFKAKHRG
ncbi:MAG TPA: type II toxin-antitoxin system HicB family antitoxin [Isosphaeraceae bacterium]|jgi:predicted HicB family RNase H-like nuclease|nr:type II toxin-antitoxin system HicB family antitoxin [Isosphaeraceae bacterium]